MTNNGIDSEKTSSFLQIEAISGIKFTPREIDILACIIGRRTAKKVALSLHISPKTVENHIRNIMQKLECNSREGIIDFIERAQEASLLKQRYIQLLCQATFEQSLKEVSTQIKKNHLTCTLIDASEETNHSLITYLKQNLESSGLHIEIKVESESRCLDYLRKDIKAHAEECRLYVLSKTLRKEIQDHRDFCQTVPKQWKNSNNIFFLLISQKAKGFTAIKSFPIKNPTNLEEFIQYYDLFFELLKSFFPVLKVDDILSKLKNQCTIGTEFSALDLPVQKLTAPSQKEVQKVVSIPSPLLSIVKEWKLPLSAFLFLVVCFSAGFISFKNGGGSLGENSVHSDLVLPAKFALLDRPELINEMNEKLKAQEGIQTIALVGLAGSGKKVLARQYARAQDAEIVWEINSEKNETLASSFERLAYALSNSDEEKGTLRDLQDMRLPHEREEKTILFVQEKLKNYPNWILIYYNVDNFSNIEKYFPRNFAWGQGKVIVTTTDSNIQDNKYINQVIEVGELNEKQRLDLFVKILHKEPSEQLTPEQSKSMREFLNQIPPFPLDVAVAAYYIKETKTPYNTYIKYLSTHSPEFNQLQEDVLKEIGEHEKTRYHIVSLSLQKLISSHPDYKDLLLHLSLMGSKNIPRDLLYSYKNKLIVDNFIHDLNKYSLTIFTLFDLDQTIPTFSIHRSIQASILDYLNKTLDSSKNILALQGISLAMETYAGWIIERGDFPRMRLALDHYLRFVAQTKNNIQAAIGVKIAMIYYRMGSFSEAKQLLEESLSMLHKNVEKNYSAIAYGFAHLGNIYREFGEYTKAKETLEKSLTLYTQKLPNDHNGRALVLRRLARTYRNLGNYQKALSLIKESVQLYQDNPSNHIEVARSEAYLGKIYKDLAQYMQAKELLNKSYNTYRKHYGQEHVETARIIRDLGQVHYLEGNFSKGEEVTQKALKIFEKSEHPERYTVFENLAEIHLKKLEYAKKEQAAQKQNFKEQAMSYLTQALAIVKIYFPPDSSHITRIQSKIIKLKEHQI